MVQKPKKIPKEAGVYIFRNEKHKPLYVGKAASIKKRLSSYFKKNPPERLRQLLNEATLITFETLPTEFDALIREAELIKKFRPKFNILMRDDKNYYYVYQTKETFPRILVTHQIPQNIKNVLGPFTEGGSLFAVLKILRKAYPYCTCKRLHKRPCLNASIGRCFGFCCLEKAEVLSQNIQTYKKSLQSIWKILSGNGKSFLQKMEQEMRLAAKAEDFELAAKLRDTLSDLQSILSHKHIIENKNPFILRHAKTAFLLQTIFDADRPLSRVEGYDISNISGAEATASLVIFENGRREKDSYKRFKIRYKGISDFDMLTEVLERRLNHAPPNDSWILPDIILIDGGEPQIRSVAKTLAYFFKTKNSKQWPVFLAGISKAKRENGATKRKASGKETLHIYEKSPQLLEKLPQDVMHLFQAVRDESHRFARDYHHLLRHKRFNA